MIIYIVILNENVCLVIDSSEVIVLGLLQSVFSLFVDVVCFLFEVVFDNEIIGVGEFNYEWNFGDGINVFMEMNFIYIFENFGVYIVSFVVFDNVGCFSDIIIGLIMVYFEFISVFVLE